MESSFTAGRTKPVYLVVEDGKARIKERPASSGGKTPTRPMTRSKMRKEGNFEVVISIGQAGERLVRYANIQTHKKSFLGRCGLGAVMGSKMLQGHRRSSGSQNCPVHDAAEIEPAQQRDQPAGGRTGRGPA
jgi:aldehyde:ferredoxin oxidoreductase